MKSAECRLTVPSRVLLVMGLAGRFLGPELLPLLLLGTYTHT
jgi:hypothetical protein